MKDEKIERLKQLDELYVRGMINTREKSERAVLRAQMQEEARLESAKEEQRTQNKARGGQSPSEVSGEVCSGRRLTFREAMSRAAKQVGLDGFTQIIGKSVVMGTDYLLAKTLCMVMAEVYMTAPQHVMYVGGIPMEAQQIKDVYENLTQDHIECVMRKIQQSRGKAVKYQRPYLRTMLYNVVFEYEAQTQAGMDAKLWDT